MTRPAGPLPIRNPFSLFLLWASKTDPRLVVVCSRWSFATQTAFGVFVIFTTVLAFCAAYYTLTTLGVQNRWSVWIALGWSIFVLFLDREIVGGLDKATAFVRPLLALIIGTIVAVPIELWIFQERIDQQLALRYRENNKEELVQLRQSETRLGKHRTGLEDTLARLQEQEADWGRIMDDELVGRPKQGRSGVSGAGPVYENAKAQQAATRQRIREVRGDLQNLEEQVPAERRRIETQFQREEVAKITNFVTRYEALNDLIHSSSALYRLSWEVTLFFMLLEMTPAIMKILTPHVDYHHLVRAEIRENVARIDEISERNYRLAMEDPEVPRLSVAEKFTIVRYTAIDNVTSFEKRHAAKA